MDLRRDILQLCAIDCTRPPERTDSCYWYVGDGFTDMNGRKWRFGRNRTWRVVS